MSTTSNETEREDLADAQAAWIEYRDEQMADHIIGDRAPLNAASLDRIQRRLRKREFIAGFMAGRLA